MQSELLQMIEREAAKGKELPEDLRPPEVMLYYMLSGVYASYQAGKLTKEQGHQKKIEVYGIYKKFAAEYEQFIKVCAEYQKRIREGYYVSGREVLTKGEKV